MQTRLVVVVVEKSEESVTGIEERADYQPWQQYQRLGSSSIDGNHIEGPMEEYRPPHGTTVPNRSYSSPT